MKLPEQAIREFQAAWLASCGEHLTYEQAEAEALSLLQLHTILTANVSRKR